MNSVNRALTASRMSSDHTGRKKGVSSQLLIPHSPDRVRLVLSLLTCDAAPGTGVTSSPLTSALL